MKKTHALTFTGEGDSLEQATEQATTEAQHLLDTLRPGEFLGSAAATAYTVWDEENLRKGYTDRRQWYTYALTVFYLEEPQP